MNLETIKEFLDFGHPKEGSIRYHKTWEKLKEEYEKEIETEIQEAELKYWSDDINNDASP